MFVLRYREGATKLVWKVGGGSSERIPVDVSGRYVRHTGTWTEPDAIQGTIATNDLNRAKVFNTEAGAKRNWEASKCDIVPVNVTLA